MKRIRVPYIIIQQRIEYSARHMLYTRRRLLCARTFSYAVQYDARRTKRFIIERENWYQHKYLRSNK